VTRTLLQGYVLDSTCIIDLGRRIHPPESRVAAQAIVANLIDQRLIKSPREVFLELTTKAKSGGDEVAVWCRSNEHVFEDLTAEQQLHLSEILAAFPQMVKTDSLTFDADPILVAMAMEYGWTLVSSDGSGANPDPCSVHVVAAHFDLRCVTEHMFLKENGWSG
jgi:hypothetical protein